MRMIVMPAESKRMLLRPWDKLRVYKRNESAGRSKVVVFEAEH